MAFKKSIETMLQLLVYSLNLKQPKRLCKQRTKFIAIHDYILPKKGSHFLRWHWTTGCRGIHRVWSPTQFDRLVSHATGGRFPAKQRVVSRGTHEFDQRYGHVRPY